MNRSIKKIIESEKEISNYNAKDIESMNLYYVACSRAIKELNNALYLNLELDEEFEFTIDKAL